MVGIRVSIMVRLRDCILVMVGLRVRLTIGI